jgi:hypothetical protein
MKPQTKERRYVLRWLAQEVRHHADNGSEWLYQGDDGEHVDEPTLRRRLKALRTIAARMQKESERSE